MNVAFLLGIASPFSGRQLNNNTTGNEKIILKKQVLLSNGCCNIVYRVTPTNCKLAKDQWKAAEKNEKTFQANSNEWSDKELLPKHPNGNGLYHLLTNKFKPTKEKWTQDGKKRQETLLNLFFDNVQGLNGVQNRVALAKRSRDGTWYKWTWKQYGELVVKTANGLLALGFTYGDHVTILSANCPEWLFADLATMCLGGSTAGIYPNDVAEQIVFINQNFDAKFFFVDSLKQLVRLKPFLNQLTKLIYIIVLSLETDNQEERDMVETDSRIISYARLLELGKTYSERSPNYVEENARKITPDTFCMTVYTSGTTGQPKGACYSHQNIYCVGTTIAEELNCQGRDILLSFLPLCHVAERIQSLFLAIAGKCSVYFAESIQRVREELPQVRPTIFMCVPRVWEKLYQALQAEFETTTGMKRHLLHQTLLFGRLARLHRNYGKSISRAAMFEWLILSLLVVRKIRVTIGLDRCHTFASGAAPLSEEVAMFFGDLGMDVRQVYGQSESTGIIAYSPKRAIRPGNTGKVPSVIQVKLGDNNEILCKGPNVFLGYYKDPGASKTALDEDGYLHTGDVGMFDEEGFLWVTDRLKDLIKTAGGKFVAPQKIENRLKMYPGISHVVVIGDRRPYCVALITLDESQLKNICTKAQIIVQPVEEVVKNRKVLQLVDSYVQQVNDGLASYEQIKYYKLLPEDFTIEREEMTPTLKIRRKQIEQRYKEWIDSMYSVASSGSS
ncbi:long-chain acyl-CoA synthetase [Galdieria sulphuraria]|uniref:Long-chain acyl-CoA synthetase n=1 Tax=Galdieria sulphuraria TaxID=130081 RepID=M2Y910_GALSU|nr:long-chain acyl-CoA synthetase [Galdieria sulphuraria]EME32573.1 long-chain acyl-CoA synthetase [Galdieria sulphuraria]|eukprot:XP_005709093.1 long-chain acyl-CoA synthetase [Galdieria sulphuraria]